MGRKRADVWNEYEEIEKEDSFKAKRVRCSHCGRKFTAHANRMKDHLKECAAYKEVFFIVLSHVFRQSVREQLILLIFHLQNMKHNDRLIIPAR